MAKRESSKEIIKTYITTRFDYDLNRSLDEIRPNYSFEVSGSQINLKTTTKFFQDVQGKYVMAPYLILNDLQGYQNGHADGANTMHPSYVVGVATPKGHSSKSNFGYEIANGNTKTGHSVSLEFTQAIDPTWQKHNMSYGLIMYKEQGDSLVFVNAFTK